MKLYGFSISRSLRAHWVLREAGVDYESIDIDLVKGQQNEPEFRSINPYGKLPVLVDGDDSISESAAICTYIAEKYPQAGLIPPEGSIARGHYHQWICFCIAEMEPHLWSMRKNMMLYPRAQRSLQAVKVARREYHAAAQIVEQHLADNACLLGDYFSAADIVMGYDLFWANTLKLLKAYPVLAAYRERLMQRPAFPTFLLNDKSAQGLFY